MADKKRALIKTVSIFFVIVTILIGGAFSFFIFSFDKAALKKQMIGFVNDKTGKELEIKGDISWSIFPWIGVKLQEVYLGNATGFKKPHLVEIGEIGVSIRVLPLVIGKVKAGKLLLKNFNLYLATNSLGKSNWQDLMVASSSSDKKPKKTTESKSMAKKPKSFTVDKISIDNGNIFWEDQKNRNKLSVTKIDLEGEDINFEKPFEIKTSFNLSSPEYFLNNGIKVSSQFKIDLKDQIFSTKKINFIGSLKNPQNKKSLDFKMDAGVEANLKKQKIDIDSFRLLLGGAKIEGSARGTKVIDATAFTGSLVFNDKKPNKLVNFFGIKNYPKEWSDTEFKTDFFASKDSVKITSFKGRVGRQDVKIKMDYISKDFLKFDCFINKLDVDSFKGENKKSVASSSSDSKSVRKRAEKNSAKDIFSSLRELKKIDGSIKIGKIKNQNLSLGSFTTKIGGGSGVIDFKNIGFDFYDGKAQGSATFDIRNTVPIFNLKLLLEKSSIKPLLVDLAGFNKFSGELSSSVDITTRVFKEKDILSGLNGSGNFSIIKGSYEGVDIPFEVRRASALINKKESPEKPSSPKTEFDSLTTSFNFNNGLLTTNDFLVKAPDYQVTGEGNANLVSKNIDFSLKAYSKNDDNFFVPIRVTGAFNSPKIRPDVAIILKQKLQKEIGKVLENGKNIPKELKEILPLDKLFN